MRCPQLAIIRLHSAVHGVHQACAISHLTYMRAEGYFDGSADALRNCVCTAKPSVIPGNWIHDLLRLILDAVHEQQAFQVGPPDHYRGIRNVLLC